MVEHFPMDVKDEADERIVGAELHLAKVALFITQRSPQSGFAPGIES